jgi:hypothetical protein
MPTFSGQDRHSYRPGHAVIVLRKPYIHTVHHTCKQKVKFCSPFSTEVTGISPIPAVNPEYVRLHVGIPREQLQTDAAGVLIVRKGRGLEAGVLVVLLEPGLEKTRV